MKTVAILGATGSIGGQALDAARRHRDKIKVGLVSCGGNFDKLVDIIEEFRPAVAVAENSPVNHIGDTAIYKNLTCEAYTELFDKTDLVLNGIGGLAGLTPTLAALESRAELATANKESIVSYGNAIMRRAKERGKKIIPVDSEHAAIAMCIEKGETPIKLILTASGGAFRDRSQEELKHVTAIEALAHPTWKMGTKVTVDSATLMNKGLEIIEAKRLFGISAVDVVIHRESIIHALVEYADGTQKAALSYPDMRVPIQYAMLGARCDTGVRMLNLAEVGALTFAMPDRERFPCLALGEKLSDDSDYRCAVLSSADEAAVELFLRGSIGFYDIPYLIEAALDRFGEGNLSSVEEVFGLDRAVKEYINATASYNYEPNAI